MAAESTLQRLSHELTEVVATVGATTVSVRGRKRMPGSGFVWSEDGLVVTANHVLERDHEITVGLPSGDVCEATLIGRDSGTDTALLRISSPDVNAITRAVDSPEVGAIALAVGRPGENGAMASMGVVTTVGGEWLTAQGATVAGYLRTDAAMLPGFSGGPLVNAAGQLLGMNSSTLGRGGGLTIPHRAITTIVESLIAHGHVRRGYLGIGTQAVELAEQQVTAHQLPGREALVVVQVDADGPAAEAGVLVGDVIVTADDQQTTAINVLQEHLRSDRIGTALRLRLLRGGEPKVISVTIGGR